MLKCGCLVGQGASQTAYPARPLGDNNPFIELSEDDMPGSSTLQRILFIPHQPLLPSCMQQHVQIASMVIMRCSAKTTDTRSCAQGMSALRLTGLPGLPLLAQSILRPAAQWLRLSPTRPPDAREGGSSESRPSIPVKATQAQQQVCPLPASQASKTLEGPHTADLVSCLHLRLYACTWCPSASCYWLLTRPCIVLIMHRPCVTTSLLSIQISSMTCPSRAGGTLWKLLVGQKQPQCGDNSTYTSRCTQGKPILDLASLQGLLLAAQSMPSAAAPRKQLGPSSPQNVRGESSSDSRRRGPRPPASLLPQAQQQVCSCMQPKNAGAVHKKVNSGLLPTSPITSQSCIWCLNGRCLWQLACLCRRPCLAVIMHRPPALLRA